MMLVSGNITPRQYLTRLNRVITMKMFFGYDRRYSVTLMLSELNLPDFDSFYVISAKRFYISALACDNVLIKNLTSLQLITSSIPYDSCSTMGLAPAT